MRREYSPRSQPRWAVVGLCCLAACCTDRPPCTDSLPEAHPATTSPSTPRAAAPPSVEAPRFATGPIPTDPSRYPYNHAASIVELPNGDLFTAWGAGSRELGPDTVILASRRRAGQQAWSPPVVVADRPDHANANPVLFVDRAGTVHLFHVEMFGPTFCLGTVVVQTSNDDATTWSLPRSAFDAICVMVRNKPIITRGGRWILPAYIQAVYQSQFWLSDDNGDHWRSTPARLTVPNNLQPAVVELADGSLFALARTSSEGHSLWQARSTDAGQTWSLCPRPDLPNPNSGIDLLRLAGGDLVLAYNNSPTERTPLAAALSTDQGRTWLPARNIETGPGQLSYPSIAQSSDGTIHVVYSHRLTHIQHAEFNRAWLLADPDLDD